ncbi:hypothetical protein YW5DRAFT_07003 [Streptomyces sp. Ncost-T6T-1]|nr:hypothetical protein YW5DRAFT_07003 [Streptomyces sp. Ncost-T6T-1]
MAGEELFESLAHFVVVHNGQSPERAQRIADQAVAFLVTTATATVPMVPSDDVDLGLHALILHTKEYAALSERYAGRFLHHNPAPGGGARDLEKVAASARAMKAAGFMVSDVHYEAPEVARSDLATGEAEPTQEADIYALGASLLVSATGRRAVEYLDDAPRPAQRRAVASVAPEASQARRGSADTVAVRRCRPP